MEHQLTDIEVRTLGALIEKEMTTPLSYPLTLNSVVTACNQKSNRLPVVSYDDATASNALDSLRDKRLVESVFPGSSRSGKYKHNFAYEYGLNGKLQALLGVLMLRGPQTAGELRTRTERMARFDSLPAVIEHLDELIQREEGALVILLPPGPGQKERRYAHLLSGEPKLSSVPSVYETSAPAIPDTITEERILSLEETVATLQAEMTSLRNQLGIPSTTARDSSDAGSDFPAHS